MIFDLAGQAQAATAASVCCSWSAVALDTVWKDLTSILPLFKILGPMTRTMTGLVSRIKFRLLHRKLISFGSIGLCWRNCGFQLGSFNLLRQPHQEPLAPGRTLQLSRRIHPYNRSRNNDSSRVRTFPARRKGHGSRAIEASLGRALAPKLHLGLVPFFSIHSQVTSHTCSP